MRGAGKSSLLETLAIKYTKIIDLFGSSDNEGLSWCKEEFRVKFREAYGRDPDILLIKSSAITVATEHTTVDINDLTMEDIENHDVITTVHAFYRDEREYFDALFAIVEMLWKKRTHWRDAWLVLIREAANWIYARLKVVKTDSAAKAEFIKSLREARHQGLAVAVDTLRWTNLDKEIRDLADYIFIKRVGAIGLPEDLKWLYRYCKPYSLMQMKPNGFLLTTSKGAVGIGVFDFPDWHKGEKENIFRSTGIETTEDLDAMPKIDEHEVGRLEHAVLIKKYVELKTMKAAAEDTGRAAGTISNHVNEHNDDIQRKGVCRRCSESGSPLADVIVHTRKGRKKRD